MRTHTIREWESLSYGEGEGQIPELLAARLAEVARSSPLAGSGGQGVLEEHRKHIRARGVVGVIAAPQGALEILPKIDVAEADPTARNAAIRKRLIHMLAVALDLRIDLGRMTELDWQRDTLLEILIRVFADKLTEAVRRGMPRQYRRDEDDLPALRGTLDVTRQFTRHAVNPSRLACRFDELSGDIALNRILKATLGHLARVSRSAANLQKLRELGFVYADVSDVPPAALRWNEVILDRTNRSWAELLGMARLFLLGRYQTTSSGAGQGSALLFEMNSLFEEYVGRLIARRLRGTEFSVHLQGGRLFCLTSEPDGRGLFQTKPDILIRRGGEVVHIIDTKWKRIAARVDDRKHGVSQSDVYQMMAYGHLYRTGRLTLLYPRHQGLDGSPVVLARNRITGWDTALETACVGIGNVAELMADLDELFWLDAPAVASRRSLPARGSSGAFLRPPSGSTAQLREAPFSGGDLF
ncbi:restriction endonuclease [Gemmobacter lutimaris]|uniref:Restriction endonuclease n=1 Tax=Gemmobacter lutimaris TaxID=2306023 RepID=A0A398BKC3_9RHOB|nr:McrC family protein [Gemmobacter lutimaris]RID89987.1 restriction endonuclease [Gemmobacter lutimaris]